MKQKVYGWLFALVMAEGIIGLSSKAVRTTVKVVKHVKKKINSSKKEEA